MTELSMNEMNDVNGGFGIFEWIIAAIIIVVGISLEGAGAFSTSHNDGLHSERSEDI